MNPKRDFALHRASKLVETNPKEAFALVLAALGSRLDASTRREGNMVLRKAGMDGKARFRSVGAALNKIFAVLSKVGIEQDEVLSAWKFKGPTGTATVDIAFTNESDPFSPEPINNSLLFLSWTELAPEKFEVVAYLS